jgi:hypothetical protein
MSDKQKKFEPSMGWIVAINHQQVSVARVAEELDMNPIELGQALERAGYKLEPDPYDLSADTWKVLDIEKKKLEVVK